MTDQTTHLSRIFTRELQFISITLFHFIKRKIRTMSDDNYLIDGIDGDALPGRLYDIKGDHKCYKCRRTLKGKIAYMDIKTNKLMCHDKGSDKTPVDAILCSVFSGINKNMEQYNQRIPIATVKKIEKALRESLEY